MAVLCMITMASAGKVMLVRLICCTHHYQNALEKDFSRDHGMHWKKIEKMCSIKEPKLPCLKHLAVIKILWRQRGNTGILPP